MTNFTSVTSGQTQSNTFIGSNTQEEVMSGGVTVNDSAGSGGIQQVLQGGVASDTYVSASGLLEFLGTISGATVSGGGGQIDGSGIAYNTVIIANGVAVATAGGIFSGSMVSGGYLEISAGGTAIDTTVSTGSFFLSAGSGSATANSTTVMSGGTFQTLGGGMVDNTVINGGTMYQDVPLNGSATGSSLNTTVENGGTFVVTDGIASAVTVDDGHFTVASGFAIFGSAPAASAVDVTVANGGTFTVDTAASASDIVVSSGADVSVAGNVSSIAVSSGGDVVISSGGIATDLSVATGGTVTVNSGGVVVDTSGAPPPGMVLNAGAEVDLTSLVFSGTDSASFDSSTNMLTITEGSTTLTFTLGGLASQYTGDGFSLAADGGGTLLTVDAPPCFGPGTLILTEQGEIPVEELQVGDRIATLPAPHAYAPVTWVGHRYVNLRNHPDPVSANPVRVKAHAIAPNIPHTDLIFSIDHAVLLDDGLVTLRYLINGATIVQETADAITYYHVELDQHAVLLANGLAAESFLDVGNRAAFDNGGCEIMLHPDFKRQLWDANACAPSLETPAQRAGIRQRLLARAVELGYTTTENPNLRLYCHHVLLRAEPQLNGVRFALPPDARQVTLVSRTSVPSHFGAEGEDERTLGVGVCALQLDDVEVPLDSPRFGQGWHAPEPGLRWSTGSATLDCSGAQTLTLRLHHGKLRYWQDNARPAMQITTSFK